MVKSAADEWVTATLSPLSRALPFYILLVLKLKNNKKLLYFLPSK